MNSFQNLKRQFGFDKGDFYRFLQVRQYIDQIQNGCTQVGWDNILLKVFIDAYSAGSNQKRISRLYKGLQQTKCSSLYTKQKWEHEGNFVLKDEDWENLCEIQWKTDIQFKFDSLYMGATTSDSVSSNVKYLFWIPSAASRKAITRRLLKPGKPTVEVWIDIIDDIFKMERITFALRLQHFLKRWETYITPIRPSFV